LPLADDGFSGVGSGLQGGADQIMQQVFVHGAIWGRQGLPRKPVGAA
jgi:hypothetical protein